jgi:hypothetical protein
MRERKAKNAERQILNTYHLRCEALLFQSTRQVVFHLISV